MTYNPLSGYQFRDPTLLIRAFTHRSFHNENTNSSPGDNEKLEFLGDTVIDLIVSEALMVEHPQLPEGELSKIRASLVNETSLSEIAKQLGLGPHIRLGAGEIKMGGAAKPRLLASTLEAIVGALYLDGGLEIAKVYLQPLFSNKIDFCEAEEGQSFASDFKTRLQEHTQKIQKLTPVYKLVKAIGPDHDKTFSVEVRVGELFKSSGVGKTKKMAEQMAAEKLLGELL